MKQMMAAVLAAALGVSLLAACAPGSAAEEFISAAAGETAAAQPEEAGSQTTQPRQTEQPSADAEEESMTGYTKISAEEARQMIDEAERFIILDVRTAEEFDEGHIPCAMLIPGEVIAERAEEELPDKDVSLFVYCRSGRRSAQAARKLADMGYTAVYDFGGIIDWPYEVTTAEDCPT